MHCAWVCLVAVAVGSAIAQEGPTGVPAADAWRDIGKTGGVCGQVVDTFWAARPNTPTLLYLERPRPEQVFTVVIPFARREVFSDSPEKSFRGKRICVTGKIEADGADGGIRGKHRAQIVVEEEEQVAVN